MGELPLAQAKAATRLPVSLCRVRNVRRGGVQRPAHTGVPRMIRS